MVHSKSRVSLLPVWKLHEGPWGSASPAVPPQGHQVRGLGDDQVSGFLCFLPEVSGAHLNITWGSLCSVVLIPCAQLHVLLPAPAGDDEVVAEMKALEVTTSFPGSSCPRHWGCVYRQGHPSQVLPEATSHPPSALWPVSLVDGAWRWGCIVRSCTPWAFTSWWQEGPPKDASF